MEPEQDFTRSNMSCSELVQFLVGEKQRPCVIHRNALVQRFPKLEETLSVVDQDDGLCDKMNFNFEQQAFLWGGISEEEFESFFQFVYAGTYDNLAPTAVIKDDPEERLLSPLPLGGFLDVCNSEYSIKTYDKFKKDREMVMRGLFRSRYSDSLYKLNLPQQDMSSSRSYKRVLKHFLKMEGFAYNFDFSQLLELSQVKLFRCLLDLELNAQLVTDIIDVLTDWDDEMDAKVCYGMILRYVASRAEAFGRDPRFAGLFANNGELAMRFMDVLLY